MGRPAVSAFSPGFFRGAARARARGAPSPAACPPAPTPAPATPPPFEFRKTGTPPATPWRRGSTACCASTRRRTCRRRRPSCRTRGSATCFTWRGTPCSASTSAGGCRFCLCFSGVWVCVEGGVRPVLCGEGHAVQLPQVRPGGVAFGFFVCFGWMGGCGSAQGCAQGGSAARAHATHIAHAPAHAHPPPPGRARRSCSAASRCWWLPTTRTRPMTCCCWRTRPLTACSRCSRPWTRRRRVFVCVCVVVCVRWGGRTQA